MNKYTICEGTGREVGMANTESSAVLNPDIVEQRIVSAGQQLQVNL
jgi:hypothetical protein